MGRSEATNRPAPTFAEVLQRLAERDHLSRAEAAWALDQIVEGTAGETQAAAFLMGLRVKGETAEEIAGLAEATRRRAIHVEVPPGDLLVDSAGTGGDYLGTFNISTTAAFVVAGAGVKVAKHGNRAASSRCGSADLLEALGVRVDLGPREVAICLDRVGMGFMLASLYHPAAGRVAALRRSLGIRTVFNFLGPLANPAGARRQLLGVCAREYVEVLAGALACMGCERALLVHGHDGMDELSVTGPTTVVEVAGTVVRPAYTFDPAKVGIPLCEPAALAGGDPGENATITRRVLAGRRGGPRDATLLNAAAALYVAGEAASIGEGLEAARAAVDSGRAAGVLESLIAVTDELAAGSP